MPPSGNHDEPPITRSSAIQSAHLRCGAHVRPGGLEPTSAFTARVAGSTTDRAHHLSELHPGQHGRAPVVATGQMRRVTASCTPTEVVRAHPDAQRHLRGLRDREFNSTDGHCLTLFTNPKSTRQIGLTLPNCADISLRPA